MAKKIEKELADKIRMFTPEEGANIYRELRTRVRSAGILDRQYIFYAILTSSSYIGFIFSLVAIYFTNSPILIVLLSVAFAFFTIQIGGLIHDAAHRAIFTKPINNDIVGHIFSATLGTGYGNWKINHNRHHAHPNQDDHDPDIDIPFSFTAERLKNSVGLGKLISRYQAWVYYPLGTLTSISLRFKRMNYFIENWSPKIYWEIVVFALSIAAHYGVPFIIFGFWKAVVFLIIVTAAEGFYMFNIFAPNHKAMPEVAKDVKFSFLEQQIITSRNVDGHDITDYIYLGLNYQIEHHLFPATPRNRLRKLVPMVKELCSKHNIEYTSVSVFESARLIWTDLRNVSRQVYNEI